MDLLQKVLDNGRKTLTGDSLTGDSSKLQRQLKRKGHAMATTVLNNFYPEALKFLEAEGYYYSPGRMSFVKDEDGISYEELDRMGLVDTCGWNPSGRTAAEGMRLLVVRLNSRRKGLRVDINRIQT